MGSLGAKVVACAKGSDNYSEISGGVRQELSLYARQQGSTTTTLHALAHSRADAWISTQACREVITGPEFYLPEI